MSTEAVKEALFKILYTQSDWFYPGFWKVDATVHADLADALEDVTVCEPGVRQHACSGAS